MATKQSSTQKTPEQEAAEAAIAVNPQSEFTDSDSNDKAAEEKKAAEEAAEKAKAEAEAATEAKARADAQAKAKTAGLMSIETLANTHRIASWQVAALNRLMGWEAGKLVTETEYKDALARLNNRRMGG